MNDDESKKLDMTNNDGHKKKKEKKKNFKKEKKCEKEENSFLLVNSDVRSGREDEKQCH